MAKVHAYIISSLRKEMPVFGKDGKKKELIKTLPQIFDRLQREHQISRGDFPDVQKMQETLQHHDFSKFQLFKPKLVETVDKMLSEDIARLMQMLPLEDYKQKPEDTNIQGGAFEKIEATISPFGYHRGEGVNMGADESEWIVARERYKYDPIFEGLEPINGKLSGEKVKAEMYKSKLPRTTLSKIWLLADVDKDNLLDKDEFALAMHLINIKLDGHELPEKLPEHLKPPSTS